MASSPSSRIFIKNLPSSLTLDDFRKHFSHQFHLTDARFLQQRRIGYVGYKTPEDAANAVKYFHKTFMGMARLSVELAKPIDQVGQQRKRGLDDVRNEDAGERTKSVAIAEENLGAGLDKSNAEAGVTGKEATLQEFLQVMQPLSKSKTWQNQGGVDHEAQKGLEAEAGDVALPETKSEDEYEPVPKKKKKMERQSGLDTSKLPSPPDTPAEKSHMDQAYVSDDTATEAVSKDTIPAASDADWLRSRTSRLLGLVDDDDALEDNLQKSDKIKTGSVGNDQTSLFENNQDTAIASQVYEDAEDADATPKQAIVEETEAIGNGRLFLRNLTYTASEEDLRAHFESHGYGELEEIHLPRDSRTGNNKGFAHIQFVKPEVAVSALRDLDQKSFQGRLLHILPSSTKKQSGLDEFAISKLPLKKQQQIKRKTEAASSTFNWNSLYMSSDSVISSVSDRLKVSKSELLDPTSSDAAIKQAHAETHVIQETKSYFSSNGVDLDAFKKKGRGDTAILVKNFSYGTKADELKKLFETYGPISKLLMPPSGTIAIIQFHKAEHAKSAFGGLVYRRFKDSLLFLEKAPTELFQKDVVTKEDNAKGAKISATDLLQDTPETDAIETSTLHIRNLNFLTTNDRLQEVFKPLDGFLSGRVKTKADPKKPGQILSMGFGFLEFRTKQQAQAAMAAMDGYKLDGHDLLIRASHKAIDAAEERRKDDRAKKLAGRRTKIIIKNLPFEASKKDVRSLFGTYGQLRSVRVPKKFDSSTRGFAFADFVTAREAENAMDALRDTHLLGRRLVLEFVAEDATDPEDEIEKMQQKVSKQSDKVALQRLVAGSARRKFNVEGEGEDELDHVS